MSPAVLNSKIQIGGSLTGEEVVISGIAGIFPKSNCVSEFVDNLYNKVDLITEEKVKFDHADASKYSGRIMGIEKFDAQFFKVTHKQAHSLEPMTRMLLEQAYCAMFDAGVNPISCKGKKIGVYAGSHYSESSSLLTSSNKSNPFVISGGSRTMLANRISYWLDSKGPSYSAVISSGSLVCLEHAYNSIKNGECEAALVTGSELTIDTVLSVNMRNAGISSIDGKTKCFDKNGDGCVRSQAIGVVFLQRAKDAKRIYAEVRNCFVGYSLDRKKDFNERRELTQTVDCLTHFYDQSGVDPNKIEYVEACGAAIPDSDANELEIISRVFGKEKSIMVGSVKSNIGDCDSVNGICALAKLCMAYNTGYIAGNLNYNDPLDIPAIKGGSVKVLSDKTPFSRGFTAINNFSYTGIDTHVILKGHYQPKNIDSYKTTIPRLVFISGRQDSGVQRVFDKLKNKPLDPEFFSLLDDIYQVETPGFTCRGYTILESTGEDIVSLAESTELFQGSLPPLCLLFSGMGSQWAGMGTELMRIPIFAASIEKCRKVLEPKGVDIIKILTLPEKTMFDNILNCFVGIAAVQIGLIDILKEIGLVPDFVIGHSLGENGCAYFDNCMSTEEMISASYTRGLVSLQTKLIKGSMAAVGLGYKKMLAICPPEIDIACHNSSEFCTISGPKDAIDTFVSELSSKGIFAKYVPTGNIAYHSRYIEKAGPEFLKQLREILKVPVKRSEKWISTSWPEEKRDSVEAELSSAEYHTNNLLSPVYFEEAARKIPSNAVVVEVAPHGLMQAIVRKSHPNCTHIPLTRRGHENPIKFLLEAFGKLYQQGYNINVGAFYPKIEYPVSTGTSPLSDFMQWYHEEDWLVFKYNVKEKNDHIVYASRTIPITIQDDDYKFLSGHVREGNIVFPEAGILFYIWNILASFKGVEFNKLSVIFHHVKFYSDVVIDLEETVNLKFEIFRGNQHFEVKIDNTIVANGHIEIIDDLSNSDENTATDEAEIISEELKPIIETDNENYNIDLNSDDIYRMLKMKGLRYEDEFKSIHASSFEWDSSLVKVTENWIIFLDSLIQLNILARNHDGVSVPNFIRELSINTTEHLKIIEKIKTAQKFLNAQFCKSSGVIKCGGVQISNMGFIHKLNETTEPDVLEDLTYNSSKIGKLPNNQDDNHCSANHIFDNAKNYKLVNAKPGHIVALKWVESENRTNNVNTVKVCFSAPSVLDVYNAVGLASKTKDFGMDYSGIDSKGNRVMGLINGGALSSTIVPDSDLLWPVPKHWTLQEAATVPLPYVHALYCLVIRGELKKGYTVLVNGGSGALGQAVISICLALKCNVYITVSSVQKKRFLKRLFPDLNAKNIKHLHEIAVFNEFSETLNNRCDVVINCANGLERELAMKCANEFGSFLNISDFDSLQNKYFGMYYLDPCKNYVNVDLSSLFRLENVAEKKLLQKIVSEGIANGMIKPINYVEYPAEEVEKAFRLLSQRRHRGRAVIKVNEVENLNVISRITYPSEGVYVVVNDDTETNLGIKLTAHLVKSGAKKIIFNHRFKKTPGFIQAKLAEWKNLGAIVTASSKEMHTKNHCQEFFEKEESVCDIFGIFIIQSKNKEINKDLASSVADNLNEVSKNNCPNLRYFVIFAGNSEKNVDGSLLDKICDKRAQLGLPALLVRTELLEDDNLENNTLYRVMSAETAIKSMEISLSRKHTKALAYNCKKNSKEFLEVVAKIIGITNFDAVDDLRVCDLVSSAVSIAELQLAIRETYKVSLPSANIEEMTILSLKNLSKTKREGNYKFNSSMGAFFNFVDCDEINATNIFIPMLTQISSAEGEENLHAKATNLMMLPGFEGHSFIFESIAKSLKIRATTLHIGPDGSNKSIKQIALDLKERIKTRFILEPKFYLLGYSFGINIALEVAALLEKDGYVGVVYCLDSSPDALRAQLEAYLGPMTEAQLQNAIIKHVVQVISGKTSKKIEEIIVNTNDWSTKVAICLDYMKDYSTISTEYKRNVINSFYERICLARSYVTDIKLESSVVLFKGIKHPGIEHLPTDYGLSKYAKNPVKILQINSDFASAPWDSRVPNFINQFLDPELLEEYKRKNLCDSYVFSRFM